MPSSGLEDLDREVRARRRSKRLPIATPATPRSAGRRAARDDTDDAVAPPPRPGSAAQSQQVRRLGMVAGLVAPAAAAVVALILWAALPSKGTGGVSQAAMAYGLALLALPTTLFTGLPFFGGTVRVLLALATSAALWLVLGRWATRRATAYGAASWRTYAGELAPMTAGVWVGVFVGLGAMVFILS